jgi:hypothetical protein
MKNYLQANFLRNVILSELIIALRGAWEAIPADFLQYSLKSVLEVPCSYAGR